MIPAALAKLISEPPLPPLDDEEALATYWSQEAIEARARRRRLSALAGWATFAMVATTIAILAFVVRVDLTVLALGLHMPFVVAAVVLLAVPSWRRWLHSQVWSPILFIVAVFGAFYITMLWPNAFGGWSVGFPLFLALFAGLLVWTVLSFIKEWRDDRRSAIDALVMIAILGSSAFAAEQLVGKDYWWLAIIPVLAYGAVRGVLIRRRERRGRAS